MYLTAGTRWSTYQEVGREEGREEGRQEKEAIPVGGGGGVRQRVVRVYVQMERPAAGRIIHGTDLSLRNLALFGRSELRMDRSEVIRNS